MKSSWKRKLAAVIPLALMIVGETIGSFERDVMNAAATGIIPRRRLEDAGSVFRYDLTKFSVRFDRCQKVKMFDDDLAQTQYSATVLSTMNFVLFRLCPSEDCASCSQIYGRYVMPMEDYLTYTVKDQKQEFESMCKYCRENCNKYGDYCTGCSKLCYQFDNLEALGYVDASSYIECQKLQNNNNNNNEDQQQLYIGPACASDGSSIVLGIFTDKYCETAYSDQDVEKALGAKISYHLLSNSNTNDGSTCLSCKEPDDGDEKKKKDEKDEADYDDVNQMCESLYGTAGKCESVGSLQVGFVQSNRDANNYENQVENEFAVCTYIQSMIWNSYTANGEINYQAKQDEVIRKLMPLQKAVLGGLSLVTVLLVITALCLSRRIEQKSPKIDLASQGDQQLA